MIRSSLALLPSLLILLASLGPPDRDQVETRWEDSPPGERVASAIEEVRPPPTDIEATSTPIAAMASEAPAPTIIVETAVVYSPTIPTPAPVVPLSVQLSARYLTVADYRAALVASPWPAYLYDAVVRIALCEAGSQDGTGRIDVQAKGDSGRAQGSLQVRIDAHPALALRYDLLSVEGGLAAGWEVYSETGSFRPWSCA